MFNKLKKNKNFLNSKKRKNLFFLLFVLLLFGVIFYPSKTYAFSLVGSLKSILNATTNIITAIPYGIIMAVISALQTIASFLLWLSATLLNVVISPGFITISYTNLDNPVIQAGLENTKPLANIIIIVFFVFISLAIALDLAGYTAKKTFVRLVVIALLVNFTTVLCGLIVDAGNIITFHFLKSCQTGIDDIASWDGLWDFVKEGFAKIFDSGEEKIEFIAYAAVSITANFILAFVFFVYAGVFLTRYVMIWCLVILSPLAFVSYALPLTKKYWDLWFKNFIQWVFIGVPAAFFLWLAVSTQQSLHSILQVQINANADRVGVINTILSYFVVVVFLVIGLSLSSKTSALGGQIAINLTKKAGKLMKGGAAVLGTRGVSKVLGEKGKEWLKKQASAKFMPEKIEQLPRGKRWAAKAGWYMAAPATGAYWAVRRVLGETGLRLTESEIANTNKANEKNQNALPERKAAEIQKALMIGDYSKAVGTLIAAVEKGETGDIQKAGVSEKDIIKIGKEAANIHPKIFAKIRDAFPHLAEEMVKGYSNEFKEKVGLQELSQEEKDSGITIPMRIVMKMKPELIPKMDEKALMHTDVQKILHSNKVRVEQVAALLSSGPEKARQLYIETAKRNGMDYYKNNAPALANYFKSNPGIRLLGGPLPQKEKTEKTEK